MERGGTYDDRVVAGFGDEWTRFDQGSRDESDLQATFDAYFSVFPWDMLDKGSTGFDLGCGSGRWAQFVAPKVAALECIDGSREALDVARRTLAGRPNCTFVHALAGDLPLADSAYDFGYSLGVLHHVPQPDVGLRDAVRCLRPGAPFLLYLYYALDNRPTWYRLMWRASDKVRWAVSRLPLSGRYAVSQVVAALVYFPAARLAAVAERLGRDVAGWPLTAYRHKPFYVMRTDALDRLGTRIEHRFSRNEIPELMHDAGLEHVVFSEGPPYWCAVGFRGDGCSPP